MNAIKNFKDEEDNNQKKKKLSVMTTPKTPIKISTIFYK